MGVNDIYAKTRLNYGCSVMSFDNLDTVFVIWCVFLYVVDFVLNKDSFYTVTLQSRFFIFNSMQGSFWVWAQPVKDNITMLRRLSLAEPILRMIPEYVSLINRLWTNGLGLIDIAMNRYICIL